MSGASVAGGPRGAPRRRLPAEWEPHRATWLAWPYDRKTWRGNLDGAEDVLARAAAALGGLGGSTGEDVEVLVRDEATARRAQRALSRWGARASLRHAVYGDVWVRDTGPFFLTGPRAAACFRWTGWGERFRLPGDEVAAAAVAGLAGYPCQEEPLALEGGALDVDGRGTCVTTRGAVLDPARNPGATSRDVEGILGRRLGVRAVVWLDGALAGDHTDGHVDTLARFVAPGVVVAAEPAGALDPNAEALRGVLDGLRGARDADGRPLRVVPLPSPGEIRGPDGGLAPASYANFYIGNAAVLVPQFGVRADGAAVERLRALFPQRRVQGLDARALLAEGGALHCATHQEPA